MPDPHVTDNLNGEGSAGKIPAGLTDVMDSIDKGAKPTDEPVTGDKPDGTEPAKADTPAWMSQLPEDIRNDADAMKQLGKFAKIGDLAKSYSELESKLGRSIVQPGKEASSEEVESFWQKLGKPKDAKSYGIEDADSDSYKAIAYAHNLTDAQAKGLWKSLKEAGIAKVKEMQEALTKKGVELDSKLQKEFGTSYQEKLTMLQRGMQKYGGAEMSKKLKNAGLLYDEDIVRMFILLGEQASEAGTSVRGNGKPTAYKSIAEGGTFDYGNL